MARINKPNKFVPLGDLLTVDMMAYYQLNPEDFIYEFIIRDDAVYDGGELFLSDQQCKILGVLGDPLIQNISVVSGKGVGKTALMAMSVIWFISCFANPKIVLTAPSFPQLKSALWAEVDKWLKKSLLKDTFEYTSEQLYYKDPDLKANWWAQPRTATEKENMQGLHADNMLLIVDEGSGVSDEIFEALDETMTANDSVGVNKLLTMGNGNKADGTFYDSHNKEKDNWTTFSLSSLDSPFVNVRKTKRLIKKYGWDHDIVRVSVRGLFPLGSPDALIPLNLVEAAVARDVPKSDDIHIGVDVARFGNDLTVLTWREGMFVHPQIQKGKTSTDETVDMVKALVKEIRKKTGSIARIPVKIDDTGLGGGVTDYLKLDRENNIEVIPVNFASSPKDGIYQNTPSEIWGTIKDAIDRVSLPDDDDLTAELSARKYKVPNGKIMIQPKAEFKNEFGESPDKADSLGLCLYEVDNDKTILTKFDQFNPAVIRNNIDYVDAMVKVVSVWYAKDMTVSVILGAWDGFKLYILNEHFGDENIYGVVHFINQFSRGCDIIGNNLVFSDSSADIKSQYKKMGIKLRKNRKYDEMGAIQGTVNFVNENRIVLQSGCRNSIEQLDGWNVLSNKNEIESRYGCCYAISNLVSYLKENAHSPFVQTTIAPEYETTKGSNSNGMIRNPITKWIRR